MFHIANREKTVGVSKQLLIAAALLSSATAWAAHATHIKDVIHGPNGAVAAGSVTISWPAFTTAWKDSIPAGSFTGTIDTDGRLSLDLVSNAGADPSQMFYTAQYRLNNGATWREYWIVPGQPNVTLAEVRQPIPDPLSPQTNSSQAPQKESPTRAVAPEEPANLESYGPNGTKPRSPAAINSHAVSNANGHRADFYHDPDRNAFSNANDSWLQVCNYTSLPGWAGGATGWTGTKNNCIHEFEFNAAPGFSLGTPAVGPGGWSTHDGINITSVVNSPGISEMVGATQIKAGIGDNTGFYFYNYSYGGAVAGSDEGNHLTAALGGEQNTVYTGTIERGGKGSTSLKVRCSADCDYPGDGRYLIDTQRPFASGYVTARTLPQGRFTPGTFSIDSDVSPSSAWGTLAADAATPIAAQIGTGSTNMNLTVNVTHGRFASGDLVCFGGQYHEQAIISSVSGSGPVTITVPLRHAHEAGSWIMQGGPCGTFIEFTANSFASGKQTIRYPVDILGATDAHTLVYRYFALSSGTANSGYWAGNVSLSKLQAITLNNNAGTVTMTLIGGERVQHPEFFNTASIYISNAANPRFNGVCSNTKITPDGHLTCTQTSSTGQTSDKADLSYGSSPSGNTAFNLWAGAEVLDVLDHSVSPPAVNGALTLEPNSADWNANDSVENVHHYAAIINAEHLALNIYNPMKLSSDARVLYLNGPGISGGNPAQPTFYAADRIVNYEVATNYAYHGGTVTPPGGILFANGLFNYALSMQYAPDPPGTSAMYIGCPLSGCADGAFFYNLFTLGANGGSTAFTFTPATNTLSVSGKGLNLKNDPLIGATLQGETRGATATLQFSPLDASGNPHLWALVAPPVGNGFTLNLPQASGTLALNATFGASGLKHSAGMVPDPGLKPGQTRFLREDGKWATVEGCQESTFTPSVQPAVLRLHAEQSEPAEKVQPTFPSVVAHTSRDVQDRSMTNLIDYVPGTDGTFRLTISVFVESPCSSGTLSLSASLTPVPGHPVGTPQTMDCTKPFTYQTATITAHGAAGVPITPEVEFSGVEPRGLRYMVDVILEQLQ